MNFIAECCKEEERKNKLLQTIQNKTNGAGKSLNAIYQWWCDSIGKLLRFYKTHWHNNQMRTFSKSCWMRVYVCFWKFTLAKHSIFLFARMWWRKIEFGIHLHNMFVWVSNWQSYSVVFVDYKNMTAISYNFNWQLQTIYKPYGVHKISNLCSTLFLISLF